jgi:hypothetical protein
LIPREGDDPHEDVQFFVLNTGRGIAKYFGFMANFPESVAIVGVGVGFQNVTHINQGHPTVTFDDNHGVIHSNGITNSLGIATIKRPNKNGGLEVALAWYAENTKARQSKIVLFPGKQAVAK